MLWYDFFSLFYDKALEDLYRPHREQAVLALGLRAGDVVLDIPCGTGQSFDFVSPIVGAGGGIIGIDSSKGMLRKAQKRVHSKRFDSITLMQTDVSIITPKMLDGNIDHLF